MGTEITKTDERSGAFELAQRQAKALAASELVPATYRNKPANCMIAMELSERVGASTLMIMQNLHIIQGRPSWSSTFLIAAVNSTGRWSPLKFRQKGTPGKPDWGCRAWAKDKETGEECVGPLVSLAMAKAEGWSTKGGSKWTTMPELMLMYRSAAFWARLYAPEVTMGIHTADEVQDMQHAGQLQELPAALAPGDSKGLEDALLGVQDVATSSESPPVPVDPMDPDPTHDPETGEVTK